MHKFWMNLLQRLGLWEPGSIYYIGGSDVLPPPLPPAQEQDYLIRMEAGEQEAKSVLIERNLRLVVYIARRFENTGVNIEDLISIGTIGLIKAGKYLPPGEEHQAWPPTLPGALKTKS